MTVVGPLKISTDTYSEYAGQQAGRILLLKKELHEMGDVRDIAEIVVSNDGGCIKFRVAFNEMPEQLAAAYVDKEGYYPLRYFEHDGQWHFSCRRRAVVDILE